MATYIPAEFVVRHARVGWRDVRFGHANGLLDREAVIDLAIDELSRVAQPSRALLHLAAASSGDPIEELLDELAASDGPRSDAEMRDKWLYLLLAWLFEQRHTLPDPLDAVALVYADFGYPEDVAGFVRYMPTDSPDLGSRDANEQRLIERWHQYLVSMASRHGRS